jgi:hypothetical protein
VIDAVAAPPRPRAAAVPLNRDGILGCHQLLQDLVDALRHAELVRPRGVAMLRRLLQDGGSLLYAPGNARALEVALCRARAALLVD